MNRNPDGGPMNRDSRRGAPTAKMGAGSLLALLAVLVLAACGSSSSSGSSSAGLSKAASNPNATMIVNFAVAPATLDPDFTEANQEVGIDGAIYSTLTQQEHVPGPIPGTTEANLSPTAVKPYVAESWQFTNGDRTLTFHLRPNLKFPSGDPLNAQAVVWSRHRLRQRWLVGLRGI
jgi:peptide/nickel transport system substrate-binding protein